MSEAPNKIDAPFDLDNIVGNVADNISIISLKPTAKYASGARTTLKINNEIVGFAFSISWNIKTTVTEIRTIDNYLPYELAPKHVVVDGTMGMFHIPGKGLSSELMQADVLNFLQQKYISIEVKDSATDNLLFFTTKAMITGRAETLNTEQLGRLNVTWQAIGWKDEREPTPPIEPSDLPVTRNRVADVTVGV